MYLSAENNNFALMCVLLKYIICAISTLCKVYLSALLFHKGTSVKNKSSLTRSEFNTVLRFQK